MIAWTILRILRVRKIPYFTYNRLVRHLQGRSFSERDKKIEYYLRFSYGGQVPIHTILQVCGFGDALCCLLACATSPDLLRAERLFAVWCAEQANPPLPALVELVTEKSSRNGYGDWVSAAIDARDVATQVAMNAYYSGDPMALLKIRDAQKQKFIELFCTDEHDAKGVAE